MYRDAYLEAMYPEEDKQVNYGSIYPMEAMMFKTELTRKQIAALNDLLRQYSDLEESATTEKDLPKRKRRLRTDQRCFPGTTRLFCTENTPATPFALMPAKFLSDSRSTTPSRVTCPLFTTMRIGRLEPTP